MSELKIAPIVEGHGDQQSIRILLTRIWTELLGGGYLNVLTPIRSRRSKLVQTAELLRAVDLAALKLAAAPGQERRLILILFDADDDLPCILAPRLREVLTAERPHLDIALVIANVEYETWFVAAAESLSSYLEVPDHSVPSDPEGGRSGKGWIEHYFKRAKYTETLEQPRMTNMFDLNVCRLRSPSFDKLCRELGKRFF